MMLLLLLLLCCTAEAERVVGTASGDSCVCELDLSQWSFPVQRFESLLQQLDSCNDSLGHLQAQMQLSARRLPEIQAMLRNASARLEPFQYLHLKGLYSALNLRVLEAELSQVETNINGVHKQLQSAQTLSLSKEMKKLRREVSKMQVMDTINMRAVKEKLRYLKNTAESCKSIPTDFLGNDPHCSKGLITSISTPVVTKVSPYGKSYHSGSWGKEAQQGAPPRGGNIYWVQALLNSHIWGHTLRTYNTYQDLMASTNAEDINIAPSNTHTDAIEGPSGVMFGGAFYYHCYRSADVCRYDLNTQAVARVKLPGVGVGFGNKFPYCYYDCRANSDVDLEADETGLWAIYATLGNHGNMVLSRLSWDAEANALNVTQTWETRLFKKSVTNAFMACGVLYATRYLDESHEEVFYAFDAASGREDNTLSLPLEKVAVGVASLSYNPTDRKIYMYNDAYLLAYQAYFRSQEPKRPLYGSEDILQEE